MTTESSSRVGAIIPTSIAGPEDIASAARFIEDAGFGEVWVAEDYFFYGGMSTAGLVLETTESIQVGLGIVASVARHPAVTAMEFATLGRAYPGRFLPGIGHGVPAWTKQMGLYPKSPLGVFREVATSVRRLVEGETLDESGHYTFNSVTLTHPSPRVGDPRRGGRTQIVAAVRRADGRDRTVGAGRSQVCRVLHRPYIQRHGEGRAVR